MTYVVTTYWESGYVTGDSVAALTAALQEVEPGTIIELFQLQLNLAQHGVDETYYFHAGVNEYNTGIVWNGQTYTPLPIEADGFEWNGQGSLPRPKVRCSNINGTVTILLNALPDGLEGAKFTRIRTLGRFLDTANFSYSIAYVALDYVAANYTVDVNPTADPLAEWPREIYYVDRKAAENRDVVEFELASAFDLVGVRAPRRQCLTRCQWTYRGEGCNYSGTNYFTAVNTPALTLADDICAKNVDACKLRFGESAELPYGGFPGIGTYFV